LVAYHYAGPARSIPAASIRAALLIRAATCASDAAFHAFVQSVHDAKITDATTAQQWQVSVKLTDPGVDLSAALDLETGKSSSRTVNGEPVRLDTFFIDDRDIATEILSPHGAR
jgi:hypothetical protein